MNQAVKEKWLAALSSGEYAKGRGQLVQTIFEWDEVEEDYMPTGKQYCCLGVLCDLAVAEGVIDRIPDTEDEGADYRTGLYLPDAVEQWAELEYEIQDELAQTNDDVPVADFSPVIPKIEAL